MLEPSICPYCGEDFQRKPIPPKLIAEEWYDEGITHYSRVIGLYDRGRDMVMDWLCPDCGETWKRE